VSQRKEWEREQARAGVAEEDPEHGDSGGRSSEAGSSSSAAAAGGRATARGGRGAGRSTEHSNNTNSSSAGRGRGSDQQGRGRGTGSVVRDEWDTRVFSHTNWDDWQLDLHHMSPGCAGGYLAMLLARLDVAGSDAEDAEAMRAVRVLPAFCLSSALLYSSLAA